MPAAVLFDLDGTLVDTEPHWWRATATVARGLGVDLGPDDEPDVLGRTVEHTAAHLLSRAPPLPRRRGRRGHRRRPHPRVRRASWPTASTSCPAPLPCCGS
ncbi:hypothetical protein ACFSTC_10645 [Nonomuraea ferruginea]